MTILQALDRYYGRMAARGDAEMPGFSREKISYAIVLSPEGEPVDVVDLRATSGKKQVPVLMEVPAAVPRRVNILANTFWDKTEYSLGRSADEDRKTPLRHEAFKSRHRALLEGSNDEGLIALARFVERWDPASFDVAPFMPEMLDSNVIFRLNGDQCYIHQRDAAQRLLATDDDRGGSEFCLVTGVVAPSRRLHPTIKGVQGAQMAGAALVSFNLDAFTSYGKEQGANAPVSELAAFRYGAALNRMLDRGSRNRLDRPIGDATMVFWADASEKAATVAEALFDAFSDPPLNATDDDDSLARKVQDAAKLRDQLEKVAAGRPQEAHPDLTEGIRFHVLGLAPNAARLSVRYWLDDDFSRFAGCLLDHWKDMRIEPRPKRWGHTAPSIARLLVRTTALQEKFENVPPQLAGEAMRAVLAGTRYPHAWLAAAIIRLRAGDDPSFGWHAAIIRGVLERDRRLKWEAKQKLKQECGDPSDHPSPEQREIPVSLDKKRLDDPAYHLGRLFAALETAQRLALGRVNASIRDRYFGAASATPAGVFPLLLRGVQNHVAKLRKEGKDVWIEREIGEIVEQLPPALPRTLKLDAQGRFAIGYYHQRQAQFAGRPKLAAQMTDSDGDTPEETTDD